MLKLNNLLKNHTKLINSRLVHLQNNGKCLKELAIAYNPQEVEKFPYEDSYFKSKKINPTKHFSLILPPPNITGTLHLGHALTASIQDAIVKWNQICGQETIWVPGLDHAGIATQVIVEKKLWKEKRLTRHQLGREKFEEEVWKWKNEKSSIINQQLKRLNLSLNWDKEVFTMDKERSQKVTDAFIKLFNENLIYRQDYLVNWSCALQSAVSDIEVDHISIENPQDLFIPSYSKPIRFGVLTKFAYKLENSNEEIIVATTRPETILGDVAVAVHPEDTRYNNLIGKRLIHPFRNDFIPIIADKFVDPNFGTGAVKLTPAHDPIDFDVSKRQNLKLITIIDEKGILNGECGQFEGIKRFEAREIILEELKKKNLLRGTLEHKMSIPICSRSKDVIEFLIKPQWFVKCSEMAAKAVKDVRDGNLNIEPKNFEKIWYHWLENNRDWCISRQLWWGHRIPAYSCRIKSAASNEECTTWIAAENLENAQKKASSILKCSPEDVECCQDEDVLDTWFSSALQPFSVFNSEDELNNYYPLSIMVTGHDILFFWVARMVMLGTQLTGKLPFNSVLLHGIICDLHGRKMSKSLGNVVAPENVIDGSSLKELNESLENAILTPQELKKATEGQKKMFPEGIPQCGADALRYTLLSHNIKNHVISFDVAECKTNQLFGNKIWQATKFTILWIEKLKEAQDPQTFQEINGNPNSFIDLWILSKLTNMHEIVKNAMENYDFYLATSALKQFLYYEFCDIYLEAIKRDLKDHPEAENSKFHCYTLLKCLEESLTALAPFMPLLAQHLHKHLPQLWNIAENKAVFPKIDDRRNLELEKDVEEVLEIVIGIRRLKKVFNLSKKHEPKVILQPNNAKIEKFFNLIIDLARLDSLEIINAQNSSAILKNEEELVEDKVGLNKFYLKVPQDLKKNLEIDLKKSEQKKEKLQIELAKLQTLINSESYIKNDKETNLKRILQIQEKISRIDYIQSLIHNN